MMLSETCIRRPVLTTLITASIIVLGVFAYRLLGVAALPAVDFPTISIQGQLPGASAETMAASVAAPIERQLSTIAGITSLTSSSSLGITSITIQFDLNRNIDGAALDVQTALTASSAMTKAEEYRKVVVAYRNGAPVYLDQVARVIDSVENDKIASWFNNERAIVLAIQRQPDANTVAVVDAVRSHLPQYEASIPPSIRMQVLMDRSISIRDSVMNVQESLIIACFLVILVIFLFLRSISATVIPALALPVSLIGTCAAMYVFGFSINNMTLLALTLSVGFVVDDAIVMLENIVRHVEGGMRPFEAALKGAREIGFTIISITFSLIAGFIPVLLMGGMVGRVFR